jgi:hypothetical protein
MSQDTPDKSDLSERDICTKFVMPALVAAGWDLQSQIREEVTFTAGRVIVRGSKVTRGEARRADFVLYYKPGMPIAVIEVKDNAHSVGAGMQHPIHRPNETGTKRFNPTLCRCSQSNPIRPKCRCVHGEHPAGADQLRDWPPHRRA